MSNALWLEPGTLWRQDSNTPSLLPTFGNTVVSPGRRLLKADAEARDANAVNHRPGGTHLTSEESQNHPQSCRDVQLSTPKLQLWEIISEDF